MNRSPADASLMSTDRIRTLRPLLALRLAARGLVRDPSTTMTAAGTLALGLAAAATFFAILHGLTRPLPVAEGDRVVRADVVQPTRDGRALPVKGADLVAWRGVPALAGVGGSRAFPATLRDPGRLLTRVAAAAVTPGALALLAVEPAEGRLPTGSEAEGAVLVGAVLAETLRSDASEPVVGRVVEVDGVPGIVAAVMPPEFGFPLRQSLWVVERPEVHPEAAYDAVARLSPGVNTSSAALQLQARWSAADETRGREDGRGVVRVRGYTEGRGETGEWFLFAGLVLVGVALLVIACANVANLLLVRAAERIRSLGVQAALGASGGQLALQVFLEAFLMAVVGGAGGLALASGLASWVERTMSPENFGYYWIRIAVDAPVMAFTGGLVVATALLAGMLPIVRVWRSDLHGVLKSGGWDDPERPGRGLPWGRIFVGAQLALSCGALVAAGLTARAMADMRGFGRELDGEAVVLARIELEGDAATRRAGLAEVREASRRIDGARSTAVSAGAPGYGERWTHVAVEGVSASEDAPGDPVMADAVDPSYFELFGLRARAGRLLGPADGEGDELVAVVSASFQSRARAGGSPLGRRVRVDGFGDDRWARVIGVVDDLDLGGGARLPKARVYLPLGAAPPSSVLVLARAASGDGAALAPALRSALAEAAPDRPLSEVRTLAGGHAYMTRAQGTFATLAVAGGSAALLVAVVGLYALLAFRVRRRRRELGVRKALGADSTTLGREVVGSALRQLVPAVAAGLVLAWIAAPLLGAILLGGDPRSPGVFMGVAAVFLTAGLGAAIPPAIRAGRVEPASVLRAE